MQQPIFCPEFSFFGQTWSRQRVDLKIILYLCIEIIAMFASRFDFDLSEVSSRNLIDVAVLRPSSSSCGGRNVTASRVMLIRPQARQLRFDLFDGRA